MSKTLEPKEGYLLLKFRSREAPEGWWLFFEDKQWGPFASREETERLAQEMIAFLSAEFNLPVTEKHRIERHDKELMPWVKRNKRRKQPDTQD